MKIELEVMGDTPLCIADAIITHEMRFAKEEYTLLVAREGIRQIGQALVNYADAQDRVLRDCNWLDF